MADLKPIPQMKSFVKKGEKGEKRDKRDIKLYGIYSRCLLHRTITLPINVVGKYLNQTIEKYIKGNFEGKCLVEGFVKRDSCKVVTYSSGIVQGKNVVFDIVIECQVCFPVEGMLISCVAKNITKAGIRAESVNETPSPVVVFIARDHHYNNEQFANIQEGETFTARVIGQRFELNDKYISIIAELTRPVVGGGSGKKPSLLIIED